MALRVLAAIAIALTWIASLRDGLRYPERRRTTTAPIVLAASAIRADARGQRCTVMGAQELQLDWYSGCRATLHMPTNALVYVVRYRPDRISAGTIFFLPGIVEVVRHRP